MKKLLLISTLVLAACTEDPEELVGGDAAIPAPDASSTDAGINEDAAIAADATTPEEDAGVPARTFGTKRMFGEGRVDNLVFDPSFDTQTYSWYAINNDFTAYLQLEKHIQNTTPTREPAVRVLKDGSRGGLLYGSASSEAGPLSASVWVGRDVADLDELSSLAASIVGVGIDGPEVAFDLTAEESSQFERDGVVWIRLSTVVTDAIGTLSFLVGDDTRAPFWVSGPSVVPVPERGELSLRGRRINDRERTSIRTIEAEKQKRRDPRKRREADRPRPL